jgi:hypothetical protein
MSLQLAGDMLLMTKAAMDAGVQDASAKAFATVYGPAVLGATRAAAKAGAKAADENGIMVGSPQWRRMERCIAAALEAFVAEASLILNESAQLQCALLEDLEDCRGTDDAAGIIRSLVERHG